MNSLLLDEYFVFFFSAILKNNILLRFSGSKSTVDVRCRCCVQWKWWAARGNSHHYINCWIYRTCWQVNNNNTHISTHLFLLSLGYDTIRYSTSKTDFVRLEANFTWPNIFNVISNIYCLPNIWKYKHNHCNETEANHLEIITRMRVLWHPFHGMKGISIFKRWNFNISIAWMSQRTKKKMQFVLKFLPQSFVHLDEWWVGIYEL